MPKPRLAEPQRSLSTQIINALLAGLKIYRPDLSYPQSHSDMDACVRNLMQMFKIELSPVHIPLRYDRNDVEQCFARVSIDSQGGDVVGREPCGNLLPCPRHPAK